MAFEMLFSPMNIGSMRVKNRIVMSAAEFSLGEPSGRPTEQLMDYYEERAKGGVGLIIPGICRVNDRTGAATFTQLSMSRDANIESMQELASRIHKHGAKLCIQLHHAGRQGYSCSLNSLPLVIPLAERIPSINKMIFKCALALMKLEQKKSLIKFQVVGLNLSRRGSASLFRRLLNVRCSRMARDVFMLCHAGR